MPKFTAEEMREIRAYERPTLALVKELTAGMRRGGRLMAELGERRDDAAWREQMIAECRSWRKLLDALPGEPPAVYGAAHARILRWAAAVAEAGDDYAAAIEERDDQRLVAASRKMIETPALYLEVNQAVREAVQRMRS
jgi:hypothetical protein